VDVLPLPQRRLWPELAVVQNEAFVLYGGTAVALFLGHRESVDFDFFTHQHFQPEDMFSKFRFLSGAEVLQSQPDTLTVLIRPFVDEEDGVKVSFFGGLTFGRLEDPQSTVDGVLQVASPRDLLAHKLKVLLQRVEPKDYQDIDALLQSGLDLAAGLGGAKALFAAFAPSECLKALTYFDDKSLQDLPRPLELRLLKAAQNVRSVPQLKIKGVALCDHGSSNSSPSPAV
jgi:Nucleotidyl transferase AbiEii toxin, Type IV TA system